MVHIEKPKALKMTTCSFTEIRPGNKADIHRKCMTDISFIR